MHTDEQEITVTVFLLRCALADLQGALQAFEQGDMNLHDWKAHSLTICDLQNALDTQNISQ